MKTIQGVWRTLKATLKEVAKTHKVQADKKWTPHKPFQVGGQIYLLTKYLRLKVPCKKLGPKYLGPFTIVRMINQVTMELKLPWMLGYIHLVFHSSLLKPVEEANYLTPTPATGSCGGGPLQNQVLDSQFHRGRLSCTVEGVSLHRCFMDGGQKYEGNTTL